MIVHLVLYCMLLYFVSYIPVHTVHVCIMYRMLFIPNLINLWGQKQYYHFQIYIHKGTVHIIQRNLTSCLFVCKYICSFLHVLYIHDILWSTSTHHTSSWHLQIFPSFKYIVSLLFILPKKIHLEIISSLFLHHCFCQPQNMQFFMIIFIIIFIIIICELTCSLKVS